MKSSQLFTSGEFAKLCNTSKVTLRHYKEIGLLLPTFEGENGYQYYEAEQFYDYYLIHILKKTGTPLAQIHSYMENQNPSSLLELLRRQRQKLQQEMQELEQMEQVVLRSMENIEQGINGKFSQNTPSVLFLEEEHLIAIPVSELSEEDEELAFISLLHKYSSVCLTESLITDYQTGAILNGDDFCSGKQTVTHIYTKIDKPSDSPYYRHKPAGYYLTFLDRGHWDTRASFEVLLQYMKENQIRANGAVFEYDLAGYLLNGQEKNTMSLFMIPVLSK